MLFRQDKNPRRLAVQAMHKPRSQQARVCCLTIEMTLGDVGQCSPLMLTNRMRELTRRLVHNKQPGIFEQDVERPVFCWKEFVGRFHDSDADGLALENPDELIRRLIVDPDDTGADHALNTKRRVVSQMPVEERVDTHTVQIGFDVKFENRR